MTKLQPRNKLDPLEDPASQDYLEMSHTYSPEDITVNGWIIAGILAVVIIALGIGAMAFFWNVTFRG